MKVHEALSAVMADVQAVGKNDVNKQQGWSFRGVDAVVNAVGPALRKHGVTVVPKMISCDRRDVPVSEKKSAHECVVEVEYRIIGPEGDELAGTSVGESIDYGDKATAQAMSVAYRTWWLQLLCVPTDEPDPDERIVERAPAEDPAVTARKQAWRALRVEVAALHGEKDDDEQKAIAQKLWDAHGKDPQNLAAMIAEVKA